MRSYIIIFLCVLYVTVDAWLGRIEYDPSTKHLGHCFYSRIGSMKNGDVKRLEGQCAIATCKNNRDIHLTGCAPVAVEPPCRVVDGVLSKPFPECCFEIECPKGHELHYK